MRVLMAEDDVEMLDVTTYALRKHGHDVVGVTDGAAVLERWERCNQTWSCSTSTCHA